MDSGRSEAMWIAAGRSWRHASAWCRDSGQTGPRTCTPRGPDQARSGPHPERRTSATARSLHLIQCAPPRRVALRRRPLRLSIAKRRLAVLLHNATTSIQGARGRTEIARQSDASSGRSLALARRVCAAELRLQWPDNSRAIGIVQGGIGVTRRAFASRLQRARQPDFENLRAHHSCGRCRPARLAVLRAGPHSA